MKKLIKFSLTLLALMVGEVGFAQTLTNDPQIICEGETRPYRVDWQAPDGPDGTVGSTYVWSVLTGGFVGSITTNQSPGGFNNHIIINWGATPPGTYTVQVIETNTGCVSPPVTLDVQINPTITPTFAAIGPLCQNSTAPALAGTSTNGITGTWSPATISTATAGTTVYTFTPDNPAQCAIPTTLSVTIDSEITPAFAAIGPLCQNSTAPALAGTSTNGITGTWSPATISTATAGTTVYTFTPDNPAQCAIPTTLSVTIDSEITPTFAAIGPLCQNSTAPALAGTSTNGITGTWSPATISTATAGTTVYTFTPDNPAQCAIPTTLSVTIDSEITPTFAAIGPLCQNSTAPALAGTSTNGITGTWSPATISTATAGTTVYTFTPDNPAQCAIPTTLSVTIDSEITPTFAAIGPLCQNSTAPALAGTSTNGITGTWSPATISTATAGTTVYTFTPDNPAQCAIPTTLSVTIDSEITPTFAAIGPLCQNSTAPALAGTSTNGITGTWSPATISTATAGTTVYTFTPDNPAQCAIPTTLSVTIDSEITPTFAAIGPLCQNSTAPALAGTSTNGITGTWSPATISTATAGTTVYTFTPDNPAQCAIPTTLSVTIDSEITPTFAAIGPLCQNSTAPALAGTSTNGITGTWSPATISTATAGTTVYTFTPDNPAQCAIPTTLSVTIDSEITPTFAAIGPLCQNSTAPALAGTSTNGITGTWSPATISTATAGTTVYTFTPDNPAQCAIPTTLSVTIDSEITPTFAAIGPLCQNSTAPALAGTSTNGITGTWSPATISTATAGTTVYTFTPDNPAQCAIPTTLSVTIDSEITPTFAAIGPLCQNSTAPALAGTSTNGITGTWSPATISTATAGTTVYTFTPDNPAQCAIPTTLSVTIDSEITPTFAAIGPLCQNSTAPALAGTSTNGITGTWSPATISTATAGTTVYTFTPDNPAQCAIPTTLSVTIDSEITPTFAAIGPLCQNSTAPALAGTSTNGITGTWSPATISTATAGTTVYTFTPDNPAQCAIPTTLSVTIDSEITPTFAAIGPLCQNSTAPALAGTSTNGITGTWSPATISTATAGTTVYTFTPDNPAQCAIPTTLSVTIDSEITPTFAAIGPLCQNSTAPALAGTSTNGITGTWSPATISTATAGTTVYTFTPDNPAQCAIPTTLSVTIDSEITPTFTSVAAICDGDLLSPLPTTSNNGITGTWSPALNNTITTTYTFTPDAGQCAINETLTINVNPIPVTSPIFHD